MSPITTFEIMSVLPVVDHLFCPGGYVTLHQVKRKGVGKQKRTKTEKPDSESVFALFTQDKHNCYSIHVQREHHPLSSVGKQNKTQQNKTKQNKTEQNRTKQNKTVFQNRIHEKLLLH